MHQLVNKKTLITAGKIFDKIFKFVRCSVRRISTTAHQLCLIIKEPIRARISLTTNESDGRCVHIPEPTITITIYKSLQPNPISRQY